MEEKRGSESAGAASRRPAQESVVNASTPKTPDLAADARLLMDRFDLSHFDANAILRGMQLTLVGAFRALQNPKMFSNDHYRQVAIAIAIAIVIRIVVSIPILAVRAILWFISLVYSLDQVSWDDAIIESLDFIGEYVLQVPFFLMSSMRHFVPTLDNLFMQSLQWVDATYVQKHGDEQTIDPQNLYYSNLVIYPTTHKPIEPSTKRGLGGFMYRSLRKAVISLAVFGCSYLPVVGGLVLPAASFYTFHKAVGLGPASVIFGIGLVLPRHYLVVFLQTYFSSRSLMRELLEPYFTRVQYTKSEKKKWFMAREGVLFGFGLGFFFLMKIPLFGVLMYGIAEASTAYLITKVTDPPPHPDHGREYAASQQIWRNKHKFLRLSVDNLDGLDRERPLKEN